MCVLSVCTRALWIEIREIPLLVGSLTFSNIEGLVPETT